ncbi:hypothetical protein PHET_11096 [Paragonimus heterotremus]|uniref:Uncharacterized protein n=1 Tax=Paragonimus heterotremus TaxID=100268 RepID=A0A8J4STC8_9TREM|nr:hypothetical protein PHET_11096 [Paragonimus heterotremus]
MQTSNGILNKIKAKFDRNHLRSSHNNQSTTGAIVSVNVYDMVSFHSFSFQH